MEEIVAKVGISKTSVYNIIALKNTIGFKLALYHTTAEKLAKEGLNIHDYADFIRTEKLLEGYGIDDGAA
jgi:hypothetical protein